MPSPEVEVEPEIMHELSKDAYTRIEIYLGKAKADEVAQEVQDGERTAHEANQWSKEIEELYEKSRNRPDIEPEDWQKFEEGWRPKGW